jgi:hypothetical protein
MARYRFRGIRKFIPKGVDPDEVMHCRPLMAAMRDLAKASAPTSTGPQRRELFARVEAERDKMVAALADVSAALVAAEVDPTGGHDAALMEAAEALRSYWEGDKIPR